MSALRPTVARTVAPVAAAAALLVSVATAQPADRSLRVVLFEARGVGDAALRTALAAYAEAGIDARTAGPRAMRDGTALDGADAVLFTGGRGSVQGRLLGARGRAHVRRFVRRGGGYVGICAGAYLAIQGPAEFHKIGLVAGRNLTGDRWRRGIRPAELAPADGSAPVVLHYANGPLFAREPVEGLPPFVTLATFDADVYLERFDTHPGEMPGTPAVVAAGFGRGRVLLFSPNPTLAPARPALLSRGTRWAARGGPVSAELGWADVFE
ncbi:MAG TPA: BPL-N domain-containing protein [Sandaracinaceae bacterium LLY-WYZ-13_1]|nr:BPL-N domain-containing protein [Sandaracinaceae bacterium LLY-WYZ-13_1]